MGSRGGSNRPFNNGVKPGHVVVLLVFLLIKFTYGGVDRRAAASEGASTASPSRSGHETDLKSFAIKSKSSHGEGLHGEHAEPELHDEEDEHGEGHGHGYQVFHVEFDRVELPFIIALWIFVSSLAKIGFHMTPKLHNIFPESCLLIVVGILIGFLLFWTSKHDPPSTLTPDVFFLFMLPPIILDAGYFMPNRLFFDHLGTILLMAVVGTIFNALTIGAALYGCGYLGAFGVDPPGILETFLFSSLISAVDPVAVLAVFEEIHVDEILYIVVFGESLLNDAVTVVLYQMFDAYVEIGEANIQVEDGLKGLASFLVVALGGTIVGIIWGYVTGFVTRFTNHARILEPLFVFTMAYLSYLNAEIFHLSGIMAITFCGITMKNYVERNISPKSQTTLKYAMKMLSGSSETIIFMFLGVATIHDKHDWNWAFVTLTIFFCSIFRALGVLLLTALANNYRLHKLSRVDQFVMMYGGLRGAVAFALVLLIDKKKVPHAEMFVTTTIAMVYWTVFVQGITIKPLVKFLNVKVSSEKDPTMNERIAGRFMDHVVAGMEGILGELGNLRIRDMYKRLDDKYIKPCLLRENHFKDPKIIETYENLAERDALEFMKRNPTQFAELAGAKTMHELAVLKGGSNGSATDLDNIDPKELHYNETEHDLDERRIHHVLSENLFMPRNRPRKLSYSRHAINDGDAAMGHGINFKVHMQVRRMMSENKNVRKRTRQHKDIPMMATTFPGVRMTGASKKLMEDQAREVINNSQQNGKAVSYQLDQGGGDDEFISFQPRSVMSVKKAKKESTLPTPWMLNRGESNHGFVHDEADNDTGSETEEEENSEPIQAQTLPWKHEEGLDARAQEEFPAWIKNKDYLTYSSPSNTLMGTSKHASSIPSVIGFFRQNSHVSPRRDSLRRDSLASTGSTRRNNSELELMHQASINETEVENWRQKQKLRYRRNTYNDDMIPENDASKDDTKL